MGKKHKKRGNSESTPTETGWFISRRGWKIIGGGIGVVALGFIFLSFTDPRGQNAASVLSPLLILGGYALIGVGIMSKNPSELPSSPSSSDPS